MGDARTKSESHVDHKRVPRRSNAPRSTQFLDIIPLTFLVRDSYDPTESVAEQVRSMTVKLESGRSMGERTPTAPERAD